MHWGICFLTSSPLLCTCVDKKWFIGAPSLKSILVVHPLHSSCLCFLLGAGTQGGMWERSSFSTWASLAPWRRSSLGFKFSFTDFFPTPTISRQSRQIFLSPTCLALLHPWCEVIQENKKFAYEAFERFLALLQTPMFFTCWLLKHVRLRRLSSLLPWSCLEIASVTGLSSACPMCVAVGVLSPHMLCSPPLLLQAGGAAINCIHTFLSPAKTFFCSFSKNTDFQDGKSLIFLVGDPLKLMDSLLSEPELMQHSCHCEKILLSSLGNKWLIREQPEEMCDCWIRKLYGWLNVTPICLISSYINIIISICLISSYGSNKSLHWTVTARDHHGALKESIEQVKPK